MIVFFSSRHHHFHIPYYSHRIVLITSHFLFFPKQLASTGSFHPISRCCRNPSCQSSRPWNINHQIKLEMVRLAESENEPSQFCSPEQKKQFQKTYWPKRSTIWKRITYFVFPFLFLFSCLDALILIVQFS